MGPGPIRAWEENRWLVSSPELPGDRQRVDTVDGWPDSRVATRSCRYGAAVIRVPCPGAWRREDTFLGGELGLELLPRKGAGVGVGGRGERG